MGFVILMILGAYLLISAGVVAGAIIYAEKHGKSTIRWGVSAALVMFLIPCWDWIPTVVAHKYYCEKEAGFWVYKTLDQWKAENPGVMGTLVANKPVPSMRQGDMDTFTDTYALNQRIVFVVKQTRIFSWLPVYRIEQAVVDNQSNTVLVRDANFGSYDRKGSNLKFWMHIEKCNEINHKDQGSLGAVITQLEGAK